MFIEQVIDLYTEMFFIDKFRMDEFLIKICYFIELKTFIYLFYLVEDLNLTSKIKSDSGIVKHYFKGHEVSGTMSIIWFVMIIIFEFKIRHEKI